MQAARVREATHDEQVQFKQKNCQISGCAGETTVSLAGVRGRINFTAKYALGPFHRLYIGKPKIGAVCILNREDAANSGSLVSVPV